MKKLFAILALGSLAFTGHGADYEKAVSDLIPRLAAESGRDRYAAQLELQALAADSSKPGSASGRTALGKVLAAKLEDPSVPQPARVWIVRQLEYMGGAEAVDALAKIMNGDDAELRECARRALEKNPDPRATASLRAALAKAADPTWKIGLINSLAQRGDTEAVGLIVKQLDDDKAGGAAVWALGRIATPAAVNALWTVFGKNPAASQALIEAGDRLIARGDAAAAKPIFLKLFDQGSPLPVRVAALVGLAKADPTGVSKLINDALNDNESRLQFAAIAAARLAYGKDLSQKLSDALPTLGPAAKAVVLGALDSSAEKQIIEAAGDKNATVRLAAIEALGRVGGVASVPVLIRVSAGDSPVEKDAAGAALARMSGPQIDALLEKSADAGDEKARATAINALAARLDTAALPAILKYAAESDPTVTKAALGALRRMGGDAEIEPVARLAVASNANGAVLALEAMAERAADKPAAAKKLLAIAADNEEAIASLSEVLSALGGEDALAAVSKLAANGKGEAQDRAVSALGNWPDFAAVKPLLTIASGKNAKLNHRVIAVQGVVRLVKSSENESASARADAALAAMNAAQRDEEKKLALSALGSVPDSRCAAAIKPLLSEPALKEEAGLAGVTLAELLLETDQAAAKDLARAVKAANVSPGIAKRADELLNQ
jgi:HEAT repeat protein